MKAPTSQIRFKNATSLLDYGFSNFSYKSFGNIGDCVGTVSVGKGISNEVRAVYDSSPSFLIKKGSESNITYEINLESSVQAPVTQGQQLGSITYYLNGENLSTISLVAENSIDKINLINMAETVFKSCFTLLRI